MSVLFYSFFVLLNFCTVILAKESAPVLLWSPSINLPTVPSLKSLSSVEFSELLQDAFGTSQPMVAVFVEENLSNEDFNLHSHGDKSIFQSLQNTVGDANTEYLPSVVDPVETLKQLEFDGYEIVKYTGKLTAELDKPTVLIVTLEADASRERGHVLRGHYKEIHRVYKELVKKHPALLAVYTGLQNPWAKANKISKRVRREDAPEEKYEGLVMRSGELVVVATGIQFKEKPTDPETVLTPVTSVTTTNNTEDGVLLLEVTFGNGKLTFNFTAIPEAWQWQLNSVTHEGKVLVTPEPVGAPRGWSYFCSNELLFTTSPLVAQPTDQFVLNITGLQAQPFVEEAKFEFGPPIDCVPYFSIAIWTGIIVVLLMLFILSWGLVMLMDINTNDRFDDPKGKTITISATD